MYEVITQSLRSLVNFTDEELFNFMQKLKPLRVKKHMFYLKPGQVCHSMVIVNQGALRYFLRNEKGDQTLGFAFEGEWLGDYESFLLKAPTQCHIEALEDTELFLLSYTDMQELYDKSQRFERFGRLIAERLFIETAKSKSKLLMQTAEDRYLELLTNQPQIFERLPLALIASYLGIQPQSLSRIRSRLLSAKS
jgi:CRP-like cAMP-binding protein